MRTFDDHAIFTAPAYWASYLIDRDPGQVIRHDAQMAQRTMLSIDQWIESIRPWCIRDVLRRDSGQASDAYETSVHDCHGYVYDPVSDITYRDYLAMRPNT